MFSLSWFPIKTQHTDENNAAARFLTLCLIGIAWIFVILLIITTVFLLLTGHENFCEQLLTKLGKQDRIDFFKKSLLSANKYKLLQIVFALFSLLFTFLAISLVRKKTRVQSKLTILLEKTSTVLVEQAGFLKHLTADVRFYLLILLLVQFIFLLVYAFKLPISYDEAWTYLNFTNKSVLSSASYYPAPNNHVFFSILTNITDLIPLNNPKIKMRIINVFFSTVSTYIFFKFLYRFYTPKISLFVTTLFIFSYPVALYGIQARGYGMVLFFSLLTVYSTFFYLRTSSKRYLAVYLISITAGFYTIPTFLYFFISLQIFIICYCLNKRNLLKRIMLINSAAGVLVSILYLPIIFVNGLQAITNNPYVRSIPFSNILSQLTEHLIYVVNWLIGISTLGEFFAVLVISMLFYTLIHTHENRQLKMISLLMLILFLCPPFIIIIQRVIPFERTWIYLTIPFYIGVATLLHLVLKYIPTTRLNTNQWFGIVLAITIVAMLLKFPSDYRKRHIMDFQANDLFSNIEPGKIREIASNEILMTDFLVYRIQAASNNPPLKIVKFIDSCNVYADALILDNKTTAQVVNMDAYTLIQKNDFIRFYLKKQTYK